MMAELKHCQAALVGVILGTCIAFGCVIRENQVFPQGSRRPDSCRGSGTLIGLWFHLHAAAVAVRLETRGDDRHCSLPQEIKAEPADEGHGDADCEPKSVTCEALPRARRQRQLMPAALDALTGAEGSGILAVEGLAFYGEASITCSRAGIEPRLAARSADVAASTSVANAVGHGAVEE